LSLADGPRPLEDAELDASIRRLERNVARRPLDRAPTVPHHSASITERELRVLDRDVVAFVERESRRRRRFALRRRRDAIDQRDEARAGRQPPDERRAHEDGGAKHESRCGHAAVN
jgi:hypothetical protein